MDSGERRRAARLATLGNARFLGSAFVLVGALVALAALVLPVWQQAVTAGGRMIVPAIDVVLADLPVAGGLRTAATVGAALLLIGFGYVLKVLAVIGETQFVDFGSGRS